MRSADRSRRTIRSMNMDDARTCLVCGTKFPVATAFCPVCMLREAMGEGGNSSESSGGYKAESTTMGLPQRFEHYELVIDKNGKPVELGRGAMGVTYKAFDVDLRCPAALKVINENTSVMSPPGFGFCERPARRPAFVIPTLPPSCTWAELGAVTSMRWSS
jgi:hypothetical protein